MKSRILIVVLCICIFATLSYAVDEPVSVTVTIDGLSGEELQNVKTALKLPEGLIKDGKVDMTWLTRFERQIPEKVRDALEVFGYYKPDISVAMETPEKGPYELHVNVTKGDPVFIDKVSIYIEGAGSHEPVLTELVDRFPLHKGDVLRQDRYEETKESLRKKQLRLAILMPIFLRIPLILPLTHYRQKLISFFKQVHNTVLEMLTLWVCLSIR